MENIFFAGTGSVLLAMEESTVLMDVQQKRELATLPVGKVRKREREKGRKGKGDGFKLPKTSEGWKREGKK